MRHYAELIAGTSRKYYDVVVDDKNVTVTWGRIGNAGQSKTYGFHSHSQALNEARAMFVKKLSAGYSETAPRSPLQILSDLVEPPVQPPAPVLVSPASLGVSDVENAQVTCDKLNRIFDDFRKSKFNYSVRHLLREQYGKLTTRLYETAPSISFESRCRLTSMAQFVFSGNIDKSET